MPSSMRNYCASKLPNVHDYTLFGDYEDVIKMWSLLSDDCYNLSYSMQEGVQSNFSQLKTAHKAD